MRFLMPRTTWPQRLAAAVVVAVLVVVAVTGALVIRENVQEPSEEAPKVPPLAANERDPAKFGQVYPRHYALYLKTGEMARDPSRYRGPGKEGQRGALPS